MERLPAPPARRSSRRQRYLDLMIRIQRLQESISAVSDDRPAQDQVARSDSIHRFLSTRTYVADGAGFCVICRSYFAPDDLIGTLKCRHDYHSSCIHEWLLLKNDCPICRRTAFAELE